MAFQSVPWAVGGGAVHSPEIARTAIYAASGGAEGIVESGDFRVSALAVPAAEVRIGIGAGLIQFGGARQTYTVRAPSSTLVEIAPNTGSSTRYDLVVVRIEDPFSSGSPWQEPADPAVGPYVFPRVIENVSSSTTRLQDVAGHGTESGIALARIAVPASTATITDAMITDLRRVALPRVETHTRVKALTAGEEETLTAEASVGETWPNVATTGWTDIEIPEWATHARMAIQWNGVKQYGGDVLGFCWMNLETLAAEAIGETTRSGFNSPNVSNPSILVFAAAGEMYIPSAYRGTRARLVPKARITSKSSVDARPELTRWSSLVATIEFYERAS